MKRVQGKVEASLSKGSKTDRENAKKGSAADPQHVVEHRSAKDFEHECQNCGAPIRRISEVCFGLEYKINMGNYESMGSFVRYTDYCESTPTERKKATDQLAEEASEYIFKIVESAELYKEMRNASEETGVRR